MLSMTFNFKQGVSPFVKPATGFGPGVANFEISTRTQNQKIRQKFEEY